MYQFYHYVLYSLEQAEQSSHCLTTEFNTRLRPTPISPIKPPLNAEGTEQSKDEEEQSLRKTEMVLRERASVGAEMPETGLRVPKLAQSCQGHAIRKDL